MTDRIGYLGPRGTNTEEALLSIMEIEEPRLLPLATISDVIKEVEAGTITQGIVPIENSIEGSVNETLDMLAFEAERAKIIREITIPISHNLIARSGTTLDQITAVISIPQATAQCRHFLETRMPNVPVTAANSTAEAVQLASVKDAGWAAIGTELAAKIYGLEVIAHDIEDYKDNKTRFGLIGTELPKSSGKDKTSIACFIYEDRPGSLLQILQELAFRYVNLTKIQSRPTKKALGEYCFFIDMEGHVDDPVIVDALKCIQCKIRAVKILGSYPRG